MALTVEDGTGLAAADAYVSLADANAYHLSMGNSAWAALSDANKEIYIRRATQYMDAMYSWRGERLRATQALENPRFDEDLDELRDDAVWPPRGLKEACAELALRASEGELVSDIEDDRPITREKVGPIETVYGTVTNAGQKSYPIVDRLLRGLIFSRRTISIVRSS